VFVKRNRARPDFTPRFADPQKNEVQTVQLACPEFIEGFNRYAEPVLSKVEGFKSLKITESVPAVPMVPDVSTV